MNIDITPEKSYFDARGKIILNACPGSGKTTCIVHKLSLLEESVNKNMEDTGIVCLSFTNNAQHQILNKYRQIHNHDFRYPHLVSTIDSFNKYITTIFNLLNISFGRPKIVDTERKS